MAVIFCLVPTFLGAVLCWIASPKQEYAAYTFRPKIERAVPEFLNEYPELHSHPHEWREPVINTDWGSVVKPLQVDQTVPEVMWLRPGEKAAYQALRDFLKNKLSLYLEERNDPNKDELSNLSSYLHFGQISAQRVAFEIALYLNDRYELDGRAPNGFTGVAWCFGTHDRPWRERAIFGKIRYMSADGLKRKFYAEGYVKNEKRDQGLG